MRSNKLTPAPFGAGQEFVIPRSRAMKKKSPKMVITSLEDSPKVLIIGQKNLLTSQLVKALEKKGCQVFFPKKLILPMIKINYIFQFNQPEKTREVLEKAVVNQARYLLVEEEKSFDSDQGVYPEGYRRAEREVFNFKDRVDTRILRINRTDFSSIHLAAKQICKTMFGRKKPLPLPLTRWPKVISKPKPKITLPKLSLTSFLVGFFIFLLTLTPYLFFMLNFYSGFQRLQSFEKKIRAGVSLEAQREALAAEVFFEQAKKLGRFLPFFKKGEDLSFFAENLSRTGVLITRLSEIGQKTLNPILKEDSGEVSENLSLLKIEVDNFERQIGLTQALFESTSLQNFEEVRFFSLGERIKKIRKAIDSSRKTTLLVKKGFPLLTEILGIKEDKRYLILFQNNMELRPGGGFIGSYGLAEFKKGSLVKLETFDVYTADGQLKGHVDPPEPIKKYLDQPHFFLRDSNFSPDFAANAQQAAWFLKKEINLDVDGVIAVDLSLTQNLLQSLDGVYLPDYQKQVTSENLFPEAQNLIQREFFPGSTQKKDFLGTLARAILTQLKIGQDLPMFSIGEALKESLEEKHLQIFLNDQEAQEIVEKLGWAGRVSPVACRLPALNRTRSGLGSPVACTPDYLMIVEANLGVNKANYFVKREISLATDFSEKKVSHRLMINYQNNSPGQTFPGGVYKNYLRVFVPRQAILAKVTINNQKVLESEIDISEMEDKISWGILVEVGPGESKKVEYHYRLANEQMVDSQFAYELFFQKQAGTDKDLLFLKFNYPQTWRIKKTNFPAVVKNSSFNYNTDLSVDRIFSIEFKKL